MKYILFFIVSITIGVLCIQVDSLKRSEKVLKQENKVLKDNQNIMIWKMDDSCYNQLKNSYDGILRIQVQKEVKE